MHGKPRDHGLLGSRQAALMSPWGPGQEGRAASHEGGFWGEEVGRGEPKWPSLKVETMALSRESEFLQISREAKYNDNKHSTVHLAS